MIICCTVSNDGNHLFSACKDRSIRYWNTKTGELIKELLFSNPKCFQLSPDGKYLYYATLDYSLSCLDVQSGEHIYDVHTQIIDEISFVSLSQNCEFIYYGSSKGNIICARTGSWFSYCWGSKPIENLDILIADDIIDPSKVK